MVGVEEQIRAARQSAALSQNDLAARSGVHQPNIAPYENGSRRPSATMVARLLAAARPRPSVRLRELHGEVLAIASRHRARNVRVFGSVARDEDTPNSDLDLLVTFDDDASLLDQARLIDELEKVLGHRVDVVSDQALGRRRPAISRDAVAL